MPTPNVYAPVSEFLSTLDELRELNAERRWAIDRLRSELAKKLGRPATDSELKRAWRLPVKWNFPKHPLTRGRPGEAYSYEPLPLGKLQCDELQARLYERLNPLIDTLLTVAESRGIDSTPLLRLRHKNDNATVNAAGDCAARIAARGPHSTDARNVGKRVKPNGERPRRVRRVKPRLELTEKQQFVYELRTLVHLSFPKIAERLHEHYGKPFTDEAARKLYRRAVEVKHRKGASIHTRRPLAAEPTADGKRVPTRRSCSDDN